MRVCSKCKVKKDLDEFYKDKNARNGLRSTCKACEIKRRIKFAKSNQGQNIILKKRYYYKNIDKIKKQAGIYRDSGQAAQWQKEWYYKNKHKAIAANAKRRATKLSATPKWLTESHLKEIKAKYKLAKLLEKQDDTKRHVDHIVPLQGETVSGLHVPWNLRVITEEENLKKGNKF